MLRVTNTDPARVDREDPVCSVEESNFESLCKKKTDCQVRPYSLVSILTATNKPFCGA